MVGFLELGFRQAETATQPPLITEEQSINVCVRALFRTMLSLFNLRKSPRMKYINFIEFTADLIFGRNPLHLHNLQ
jgi:hypothetical protein